MGLQINRTNRWQASWASGFGPGRKLNGLRDLRGRTEVNRNRDMAWCAEAREKSSDRRIGVWLRFVTT